MPTFMTDNILFSYILMVSYLVRLFAVFLLNFQRMSGLDLIKTIRMTIRIRIIRGRFKQS